eukprot:TRINITY_DN15035_c0_g1_i2.p1 TRINITY_DN15035_c0_g1~~TRINITY_DN15035_c0_g1_i2.p1  ORF type:complete len:169 (+),score=35.61 TRINITY_DN15035_c0_g1_i2:163-669(+)
MEWEGVGSVHNDSRFLSPDEKALPLKSGAQFHGQWDSNYQLETLRQTGVAPDYREIAPENPFWRDIYYEWLHRNVLDDSPGSEFSFLHDGMRMANEKQRIDFYIRSYEENDNHLANKEEAGYAKEELKHEEFERYMARRAKRNKKFGHDNYGMWSKKTVAYLKKVGDM